MPEPLSLEALLTREWLETNGIGGFASGTVSGAHTRRYHGLLTAALHPPVGRTVLLSKMEASLVGGAESIPLSTNIYEGAVHPQGHEYLKQFDSNLFPTWVFEAAGRTIRHELFLVHGENTVVLSYKLESGDACDLELHPLIAFRDYHSLTHENSALRHTEPETEGPIFLRPYPDLPELQIAHNATSVQSTGHWYRNFRYNVEHERGLDFHEDLFQPCALRFTLEPGDTAIVVAGVADREISATEFEALRRRETTRRQELLAGVPESDTLRRKLTRAADQFVVRRQEGYSVIAGYPWFSDWGRDTMIALPGLTIAVGRPEIAGAILKTFAAHLSEGMLPNRFPDAGETPEYNTVDATLWFFEAARAYVEATGDFDLIRDHLYAGFREIVEWHQKGTRFGIRVDDDGLLLSGPQLTWMDAKVGDYVVTPRAGKAVEIQALWYNALCILANFAIQLGEKSFASDLRASGRKTEESFRAKFWDSERACLYDLLTSDGPDRALRPNQVIAASLPHRMITRAEARTMLNTVHKDLWTPLGLRTLASSDPAFRARYLGGVWDRDTSYHQGTIWPWLVGPFATAWLWAYEESTAARDQVRGWLNAFEPELERGCFGQLPEITDAVEPYMHRGCFAQAWSVAEILRAWVAVQSSSLGASRTAAS
jgi:predicted glycogen debranching enzyme